MIHKTDGASRTVTRVVAAVGAPLLAILAGGLSSPASAGGGVAQGPQPQLRGSYCDESDDAAPSRAGCAKINGYIAAGEHFGSEERIGGRRSPFGPVDAPGFIGGRGSGVTIIGAPFGAERLLPSANPDEIAR
jgi:hypothetical protein